MEGLRLLIRLEKVLNDWEGNLTLVVGGADKYQMQFRTSCSGEGCLVLSGHV